MLLLHIGIHQKSAASTLLVLVDVDAINFFITVVNVAQATKLRCSPMILADITKSKESTIVYRLPISLESVFFANIIV